ncbi:MAG: UPF0149 family protein, partial [Rubrivivax sp.]|nr:UPF0149 family protein [Rubrivivax sp.]
MVPIDNTPAEIDAFDAVCNRLGGFEPMLDTEWIDGFLTAVAAGPRAVPIERWLPALAGEVFERVFADPADVAQAQQALQARARVIARQLDPEWLLDHPDDLRLAPLVQVWDDDDRQQAIAQGGEPHLAARLQTGAVWADGFFDGIARLGEEWQRPADLEGADASAFDELLAQVNALRLGPDDEALKAHLARWWAGRDPTRDDLIDEACLAIQDLRVWWLD